MSALKKYIKRVKEVAEAVIEAKQSLWNWFQQEILQAKGKTDKAKRAKVLHQRGDGNRKIVANPNRHLHNLITKRQLEDLVEDDKPVCPSKDPEPQVVFKQPQVQEQDPNPEHRTG